MTNEAQLTDLEVLTILALAGHEGAEQEYKAKGDFSAVAGLVERGLIEDEDGELYPTMDAERMAWEIETGVAA